MLRDMATEDIIKKSEAAIEHIDDVEAKRLISEINNFIISQNLKSNNPDLYNILQDIISKLHIVAFPNLSDEESENILRDHYLKSFDIGIPMENRIAAKLFYIPEIPRDELRKKLQKAILENNEQFGPLTVGQWLREFEKMFSVHTRDRSAPVRFIMEHPQARALSEIDKAKLKEIVHTYDYFLVSTLPATGPVLEEILNSSMAERRETRETAEAKPVIAPVRTGSGEGSRSFYEPLIQRRAARFPGGPSGEAGGIESLPLSQALQKYPRLGEQAVTGSPIKLKIFPDPARPSIKNWIAEYHSVLGAGSHGTMERGNFLYHSENAKRLSFGERQKLAVILKSLDENEPVAVDGEKQEIVFSELSASSFQLSGKTATDRIPNSQFPRLPKPGTGGQAISNEIPNPKSQNYFSNQANTANQADFRFSSPQRLQSEPPQPKSYQHFDPYQIVPTGYPEDRPKPEPPASPSNRGEPRPPVPPPSSRPEPKINGNVVDLRG